jgi:copper(I)-binding protein
MTASSRRPFGWPPGLVPGLATLFFLSFAAPTSLAAHGFAQGDLAIGHPWARETATGQSAGGGFLTISNKGKTEDRLTGGSASIAREVQIHSMSMDGGIMRMRPVPKGLAIPAGQTVTLRPGSFHIMFMGLKRPLKRGEMVPVTLRFARAGAVKVAFKVEAVTYGGPGHDAH